MKWVPNLRLRIDSIWISYVIEPLRSPDQLWKDHFRQSVLLQEIPLDAIDEEI